MEKGTSQFCRSAGRCGAMRHGVHAGMPMGCPLPASLGEITSFSKKPSFLGNHSKYVGKHAAKAKAKACLLACSQGQGHGSPHGQAVKAKARSQGHGMLAWARWHAPRRRQQGPRGHAAKALACTLADGAGAARRGRGMARGWDAKAVACHWDP